MLKVLIVFLACSIAVLGPGLGCAQNLVTNGDFDSDTSTWTPLITETDFSHNPNIDADGNGSSGSGQLANLATNEWGAAWTWQCITTGISGGANYDWGAKVRFDTENIQDGYGRANVLAKFYSTSNCSGTFDDGETTDNVLSSNTDVWIQNQVLDFTAPPGAASVRLQLFTGKLDDLGTITANFDNVVFGLAGILFPEGHLFSDGFESGDAESWDFTTP